MGYQCQVNPEDLGMLALLFFPDRADLIADSMGHSVEVSRKHYRKWFGAFTAEEKVKILEYTAGWLA